MDTPFKNLIEFTNGLVLGIEPLSVILCQIKEFAVED